MNSSDYECLEQSASKDISSDDESIDGWIDVGTTSDPKQSIDRRGVHIDDTKHQLTGITKEKEVPDFQTSAATRGAVGGGAGVMLASKSHSHSAGHQGQSRYQAIDRRGVDIDDTKYQLTGITKEKEATDFQTSAATRGAVGGGAGVMSASKSHSHSAGHQGQSRYQGHYQGVDPAEHLQKSTDRRTGYNRQHSSHPYQSTNRGTSFNRQRSSNFNTHEEMNKEHCLQSKAANSQPLGANPDLEKSQQNNAYDSEPCSATRFNDHADYALHVKALKKLADEREELLQKNDDLNREVERLKAITVELEKNLTDTKGENKRRFNDLSSIIAELKRSKSKLTSDVNNLTDQLYRAKEDARLKSTNSNGRALKKLTDEKEELLQKIDDLNREVERLKAITAEVEKDLTDKKGENKRRYNDLSSTIVELTRSKSRLTSDVNNLTDQLYRAKEENARLKSTNSNGRGHKSTKSNLDGQEPKVENAYTQSDLHKSRTIPFECFNVEHDVYAFLKSKNKKFSSLWNSYEVKEDVSGMNGIRKIEIYGPADATGLKSQQEMKKGCNQIKQNLLGRIEEVKQNPSFKSSKVALDGWVREDLASALISQVGEELTHVYCNWECENPATRSVVFMAAQDGIVDEAIHRFHNILKCLETVIRNGGDSYKPVGLVNNASTGIVGGTPYFKHNENIPNEIDRRMSGGIVSNNAELYVDRDDFEFIRLMEPDKVENILRNQMTESHVGDKIKFSVEKQQSAGHLTRLINEWSGVLHRDVFSVYDIDKKSVMKCIAECRQNQRKIHIRRLTSSDAIVFISKDKLRLRFVVDEFKENLQKHIISDSASSSQPKNRHVDTIVLNEDILKYIRKFHGHRLPDIWSTKNFHVDSDVSGETVTLTIFCDSKKKLDESIAKIQTVYQQVMDKICQKDEHLENYSRVSRTQVDDALERIKEDADNLSVYYVRSKSNDRIIFLSEDRTALKVIRGKFASRMRRDPEV